MTVQRINLLRNIGQFDSVNSGAQIPLSRLSLVYAENGRGKTTLSAILRSLSDGNPQLIVERSRLGAAHAPHVVMTVTGVPFVFENGAWTAPLPRVAIFDDLFVAQNVCSGIDIVTAHRQNLHELIIGAQGVALNRILQGFIDQVEEHNRALRARAEAIPASARASFTLEEFLTLPGNPDIDAAIQQAEQNLAAAQSADLIRQRAQFMPLQLPDFDILAIDELLARSLPDLEAEAVGRVQAHIANLGTNGERWVGEGMRLLGNRQACPFCAQDMAMSPILHHYQAYFSQAYEELKLAIRQFAQNINTAHGADVQTAFERGLRVAIQSREFWRTFTNVPDINIDTAAIERAWTSARDQVLAAIMTKQAAPLEVRSLSVEGRLAIAAYQASCAPIRNLSEALQACNPQIAIVKEQAAVANVLALTNDLTRLMAIRSRHTAPISGHCAAYLAERAAKVATENLRDQARADLNQYRQNVFPAYEASINSYLQRFNAGFRLASVSSVNTRAGSSCTYNVLINNLPVSLTADQGPSFRNTLSAGDRNTLALAFFFASLDREPDLAQKIVVIDDPMTSLDEHRALTTIQEMRRLVARVSQLIVMSHSKPFLCAIWDGADAAVRSALRIIRDGNGSTLAVWDVRLDCVTEHDRRHQQVTDYLNASNPASERAVAAALRPILEAFMRVAYADSFPPGMLLGPFIQTCRQRVGSPIQILSQADIDELRAILDYANRFHHDTNPAWETAIINDQELEHFCRRTLSFTRRA